jgi:hypothetical protein
MKKSLAKGKALISIAIVFLLVVSACKNQKSQQSGSASDVTAEKLEGKDAVIKEISEYPLPTAFEITTLLIEAGASYILDLSNSVDNVDNYINSKSKALNLGVYGADLSYAATYKQTQETMQYLNASAKLIDELQIESFNEELVEKVEANIDNVDELINLISDSFYKTYEYLVSNEQDELSILVMAGSWIEAMFITTQISIISADNTKILAIIGEQSTTLDKLIEVMAPVSDSEMSSDVYNGLLKLQEIYRKSEGDIEGEHLEAMIKETEDLRTMIVS